MKQEGKAGGCSLSLRHPAANCVPLSERYRQLLCPPFPRPSTMPTSLRGETLLPGDKPWHPRAPRVEPKCRWRGESLLGNHRSHFKRVPVSSLCRNTHAHGSHYNPIMQQPALLASHVTLPAAQPVNVGVAHVMRQPPAAATSARKSKQHQSAPR